MGACDHKCDDDGFRVEGDKHEVNGNVAFTNARYGFFFNASDCTISKNVASHNGRDGFLVATSSQTFSDNFAIGNAWSGIQVTGSDNVLNRNSAIANHDVGILVPSADVTITANNMWGNGATTGNCGLSNISSSPAVAKSNFRGAPTGPGADPADTVCNTDPGTTTVTPFAIRATSVLPPTRR